MRRGGALGRVASGLVLEALPAARGVTLDLRPTAGMARGWVNDPATADRVGMLRLAGTGVALHAKPAVQAECALRVNHGDLSALLYLQGYAREEFA